MKLNMFNNNKLYKYTVIYLVLCLIVSTSVIASSAQAQARHCEAERSEAEAIYTLAVRAAAHKKDIIFPRLLSIGVQKEKYSTEEVRKYLEANWRTVNDAFGEIFSSSKRVIAFGETHLFPIYYRMMIARLVEKYAIDAGYTHFAIEAHPKTKEAFVFLLEAWSDSEVDGLGLFLEENEHLLGRLGQMVPDEAQDWTHERERNFSDPFERLCAILGTYRLSMTTSYFEMLKAAHEGGMVIEPIDPMLTKDKSSDMERDEDMARDVKAILDDDPKARVLVYIGSNHASKYSNTMGGKLRASIGDEYYAITWESGFGRQIINNSVIGTDLVNKIFVITDLPEGSNLVGKLLKEEPSTSGKILGDLFDATVYTPLPRMELLGYRLDYGEIFNGMPLSDSATLGLINFMPQLSAHDIIIKPRVKEPERKGALGRFTDWVKRAL